MSGAPLEGGKRSAWMSHVKKTMKANKGKSLMQVLKMAKKTYKKSGGGMGGVASTAFDLTGAGKRGRRTRRRGGDDGEPAPAPISFGKRAVEADASKAQDEERMRFGGRRTRKSARKGSKKTRKH